MIFLYENILDCTEEWKRKKDWSQCNFRAEIKKGKPWLKRFQFMMYYKPPNKSNCNQSTGKSESNTQVDTTSLTLSVLLFRNEELSFLIYIPSSALLHAYPYLKINLWKINLHSQKLKLKIFHNILGFSTCRIFRFFIIGLWLDTIPNHLPFTLRVPYLCLSSPVTIPPSKVSYPLSFFPQFYFSIASPGHRLSSSI